MPSNDRTLDGTTLLVLALLLLSPAAQTISQPTARTLCRRLVLVQVLLKHLLKTQGGCYHQNDGSLLAGGSRLVLVFKQSWPALAAAELANYAMFQVLWHRLHPHPP